MGVLRVPWDGVDMVAQASCFLLVAVVSCSLAEQGLPSSSRQSRSLVGTFPFNSPDLGLPERKTRQGGDGGVATDFQSVAAAGQRCIDKITTEEETEYDEVVTCDHSYNTRCHTSYKTSYNAQQEEECDENYKKNCFIEYSKTATKAEVQICVEPLVKNCDIPGPEVCSTEYQSECETKQEVHDVEDDQVSCQTVIEEKCEDETSGYTTNTKCSKWPKEVCSVSKTPVRKVTPNTRCEKVPVEICGPSSCGLTTGPVECRTETRTIPGEKPEEVCSLEPLRRCKHVTKLVPQLEPHESCTDVPKEVCTRSQTNPRKVQKPVITKWCYTPSEESGLDGGASRPDPAIQQPPIQQPPRCSSTCERNIRNNVCTPECDVPQCPTCYPPPPEPVACSAKCQRNIRNNICSSECNVPECPPCSPPPTPICPASCKRDFRNNNCRPECNIPECPPCSPPSAPPCSASCKRDIRNNVCRPECNVPECPTCTAPIDPGYLPPPADTISPPANDYLPPGGSARLRTPKETPRRNSGGNRNNNRNNNNNTRFNGRNTRTRSQTGNKKSSSRSRPGSSRVPKQQRTHPAPKSASSNWDVLFKAGVVTNRSTGRLGTSRAG